MREDDEALRRSLTVHDWNQLWEAAQFRRRFFDENDLTPDLAKIADRGDFNIILVPRTQSRLYEYAPLYHLLSRSTCERFGLPLLGRGQWPFGVENVDIAKYLPVDFERRLSQAWAATVWRHLNSGSGLTAFSRDDPIRLLAHNLDFWIPPSVIQGLILSAPRAQRRRLCRRSLMRCCADDEGLWPFGVALRGEASNHLKLRWLKTVVVSVEEKAHVMRQVGIGKASVSEPLMTCRNK